MKIKVPNRLHAILLLSILLVFGSCKKDTKQETSVQPKPAKVDLKLVFNNSIGGNPINMGSMEYVNAAGNTYQVDVLKYYISNIRLVNSDLTEFAFTNYELIDEKESASKTIILKDVPNAIYSRIKFYVGVDAARNHTGVQDGDLDPAHDMIWDWNTGYVFFKHEGKYKSSTGAAKSLFQHLATDAALVAFEIPFTGVKIDGVTKTLSINFDLNSVYTSPTNIDFNTDGNHTSSGAGDAQWITDVKENFMNAFSFNKFE